MKKEILIAVVDGQGGGIGKGGFSEGGPPQGGGSQVPPDDEFQSLLPGSPEAGLEKFHAPGHLAGNSFVLLPGQQGAGQSVIKDLPAVPYGMVRPDKGADQRRHACGLHFKITSYSSYTGTGKRTRLEISPILWYSKGAKEKKTAAESPLK